MCFPLSWCTSTSHRAPQVTYMPIRLSSERVDVTEIRCISYAFCPFLWYPRKHAQHSTAHHDIAGQQDRSPHPSIHPSVPRLESHIPDKTSGNPPPPPPSHLTPHSRRRLLQPSTSTTPTARTDTPGAPPWQPASQRPSSRPTPCPPSSPSFPLPPQREHQPQPQPQPSKP